MLSLSLSAYFLNTFSRGASDPRDMFSLDSHPSPPVFIPDSITFGFSGGSFGTVLLSDACCFPSD